MGNSKFILEVDRENRGIVFIDGEEIHNIKEIDIHGEPQSYDITIVQRTKDENNRFVVENDMIKTIATTYHIGI